MFTEHYNGRKMKEGLGIKSSMNEIYRIWERSVICNRKGTDQSGNQEV